MRCSRFAVVGLAALLGGWLGLAGFATPRQDAPVVETNDRERLSYGVGYYLGREVRDGLKADGVNADAELVVRGFRDGLMSRPPSMDEDELQEVLAAVHREMQRRTVKRLLAEDPAFKRLHDENLRRSRAYHERHKYDEDVVTLDNGIQYKVLESGHGPSPDLDDVVVVTYRLTLIDGTVIDEGRSREVEVDSLSEGGKHVIQMMKTGDRWHVAIPPELAYGAGGDPPRIGPNETLVAEVELLGIK